MTIKQKTKGLVKHFQSPKMRGKWSMIAMILLPLLTFYTIWLIYPMIHSFYRSFFEWNPLQQRSHFIGIKNYYEAFTKDYVFWTALRNSAYYTIVSVPLGMVIALLLAIMINSLPRYEALFRTVYFLPVVTSMVAVSIIWKWLYQPRFGFFNMVLGMLGSRLGISVPEISWLGNPRLAMPSIIIMSVWKGLGYTIVLFLAGLEGIPRTYYEAAKIDGASRWHLFRYITLPLLQPTIVFILITGVIGGFQVFTQMYVMTSGGPVNATRTIVYLLYDAAFLEYRFGYASAISFILFAVILVLSAIQLRLSRTTWEY